MASFRHSPFTLANFSFVNLVFIFRCSSSTTNPVCVRHVNLLVCSLPLHGHSYIGLSLAFASSIHNKQTIKIQPPSGVPKPEVPKIRDHSHPPQTRDHSHPATPKTGPDPPDHPKNVTTPTRPPPKRDHTHPTTPKTGPLPPGHPKYWTTPVRLPPGHPQNGTTPKRASPPKTGPHPPDHPRYWTTPTRPPPKRDHTHPTV